MLVTILCCMPFEVTGQTSSNIRIGFSSMVLSGVNENDAMASLKVWIKTIVQAQGISAEPYPSIFRSVTEISAALTDKTVDCISLTTIEYFQLGRQLAQDSIVAGTTSGSTMETSVLLVHRDSGIKGLGDLRGHTIGMLEHSRACFGPFWLDILLAREGLGSTADFFGKILSVPKTGKAVLSVFFHQVDACLVTRSGFEIMRELNPQTGQQLKVLAQSAPLVPVIFCFRSDYISPVREQIMAELSRLYLNPAGRQILTLFQIDRLKKCPVSCLNSSIELLAEHRRLFR